MPKRAHYVEFHSPGSFFNESSRKKIRSWSTKLAVKLADGIKERHGALPYGFNFVTDIEADDIPDGEDGTLRVESKEVARSKMFYLGGTVLMVPDVEARNDPDNDRLLFNMRHNDPVVIENTNSYRTVQPFGHGDVIVDENGVTTIRGDDWKYVQARIDDQARRDKEYEYYASDEYKAVQEQRKIEYDKRNANS